jgi:putative NADPH-quinone reductase
MQNTVVKSSKNYVNVWQTALPTSSVRGEMKHAVQVDQNIFDWPVWFFGSPGVTVKKI